MDFVTYAIDDAPTREELVSLYDSVGWSVYTRTPDRLEAAIGASLRVVTARVDDELVGLARIVGDGLTILYLQDILVRPQVTTAKESGASSFRARSSPTATYDKKCS